MGSGEFPVYYGLGLGLTFDNKTELGIRIPIGVNYILERKELDFFAELAPGILLTPDIDLKLDIAIGIRYFFE